MQAQLTKDKKQEISKLRKVLRDENRKFPPHLVKIPDEHWPEDRHAYGDTRIHVYRSKYFLVQVYAMNGGMFRIAVARCEIDKNGQFVEDITWDDMQMIKRQAGFSEWDGVELFPKDRDMINIENMRHMFVFPESLPFAWRRFQFEQGGAFATRDNHEQPDPFSPKGNSGDVSSGDTRD